MTITSTAPTAARRPVLQALREADAADRHCIPALRSAGFSPEQVNALAAPLDRRHISQREQGRSRGAYLQSWWLIREANRIFGFDGWQRQTLACRCIHQGERGIGREQKPGWGVTYTARVRITVAAGPWGHWCGKAPEPATASTPTWAWPMNQRSRKPKPMR